MHVDEVPTWMRGYDCSFEPAIAMLRQTNYSCMSHARLDIGCVGGGGGMEACTHDLLGPPCGNTLQC